MSKFSKFWWFTFRNPVVRKGESGGFKWSFRRFWLDITTVSGNFKARFTADEHPYGYLIAGKDDSNIIGFCQMVYTLGKLLTTDQGLVDGIQKEIKKYEKRLEKVEPDPTDSEEAAIAEVKAVQEYVEASPKEKKQRERDSNGRFVKAVKKAEALGDEK